MRESAILLDAEPSGPVNNAVIMSNISPLYAPPGAALISASTIGAPSVDDETLGQQVREQLTDWWGDQVSGWKLLRIYRIPEASCSARGWSVRLRGSVLASGAQYSHRTRGAVRRREVNVDHGPSPSRLGFIPAQARASSRAGRALRIPVNLELSDIKPCFLLGLPLAILSDRTDEVDLVVARTRHQVAPMDIAGIDEVLCRKGSNPVEFGLNPGQLPEVRGRSNRRCHLNQQVWPLVVTRFGEMHLVPSPVRSAFARIARLGLVG